MPQRLRFLIDGRQRIEVPPKFPTLRLGLSDVAEVELSLHVFHVPLALEPGGQPGAGVSSAGDRRQVIEPVEQSHVREPLQETDRECARTDPTARKRQPGHLLIEHCDPGTHHLGVGVRRGVDVFADLLHPGVTGQIAG